MRRLTLAIAFALALVIAPSATAITRSDADRIALRALGTNTGAKARVLFRLSAPLPAGSRVFEGLPARPRRGSVPRLRRATWLYWEDRAPYALFGHPSVMLLIDDESGRVVKRDVQASWPAIVRPGRTRAARPPWLRSLAAYDSARFRVVARGTIRRPRAVAAQSPVAHLAQAPTRPLLNAQTFREDCLVQGIDRRDPLFAGDGPAMKAWADSVGLRRTAGDSPRNISFAVDSAIDEGCRDVFLQIAGHGTPPPGTIEDGEDIGGPAGVHIRSDAPAHSFFSRGTEYVTPEFLRELMRKHPQVTFKIKITSCYAGRFAELRDERNLLVLELSSGPKEVSYGHLRAGGFLGLRRNTTTNPFKATEFTNGNVAGLMRWSSSPLEIARVGSKLADGIARSFELGKDQDFARVLGMTHPELAKAPPSKAPPPQSQPQPAPQPQSDPQPPPPPRPKYTVQFLTTGWDHTYAHPEPPSSLSSICGDLEITPAPPTGSTYTLTRYRPGTDPGTGASTDPEGVTSSVARLATAGIDAPGKWMLRATLQLPDGTTQTTEPDVEIDVPDPGGPPPDRSKDCKP